MVFFCILKWTSGGQCDIEIVEFGHIPCLKPTNKSKIDTAQRLPDHAVLSVHLSSFLKSLIVDGFEIATKEKILYALIKVLCSLFRSCF